MTRILFRGKELSTRSRMKTLEEAIEYFKKKNNISVVKIIEDIIDQKNKKSVKVEKSVEEKKEEPKKEKKTLKFESATEEDIDDFEPDAEMEDGILKQNAIGLGKMSKDLKKAVV